MYSISTIHALSQTFTHKWRFKLGYELQTVYGWIDLCPDYEDNPWDYGVFRKTRNKQGEVLKHPIIGKKMDYPSLSKSGYKASVPDDTVSFILGVGVKGKQKQDAYLALLHKCYDQTKDDAIGYWLAIMPSILNSNILFKLSEPLKTLEELYTKKLIILYEGNRIASRPAVRSFWEECFVSNFETKAGYCLLSGNSTKARVTGNLPIKIKNVVGGQASGTTFVSFAAESSTAYSLIDLEHAPLDLKSICRAYSFTNKLLGDRKYHLKLTNQSVLTWSNLYLVNFNTLQSQWDIDDEFYTFTTAKKALGLSLNYKSFILAKFFKQYPTVKLGEIDLNTSLNWIALKGNGGRVFVQDYKVESLHNVLDNINTILRCYQSLNLQVYIPHLTLLTLSNNTYYEYEFYKALLFGTSLPEAFLANTLTSLNCTHNNYSKTYRYNYKFNLALELLIRFYFKLAGLSETLPQTPKEQYAISLGRLFRQYVKCVKADVSGWGLGNFSTYYTIFRTADKALLSNILMPYLEVSPQLNDLYIDVTRFNLDSRSFSVQELAYFVLAYQSYDADKKNQ